MLKPLTIIRWCPFIHSILLFSTIRTCIDKAPRLSISIVIWILSSDTICQLNQFNTNSEAAMLSTHATSWIYSFPFMFVSSEGIVPLLWNTNSGWLNSRLWRPPLDYYETLPKAQRTRGLSSSCQSNFLRSHHKFKHKFWSHFIFTISTKHQLKFSTKHQHLH